MANNDVTGGAAPDLPGERARVIRAPHRHAVHEFITTRQGYRRATSIGGVLTGGGADLILIDDPSKPEEVLSEARRKTTNEWYLNTLYSRLNDKFRGAIVIIMQRLHRGRPRRPRARPGGVGGGELPGDR